jgi:hypothetical protein
MARHEVRMATRIATVHFRGNRLDVSLAMIGQAGPFHVCTTHLRVLSETFVPEVVTFIATPKDSRTVPCDLCRLVERLMR